MKLRSIFNLANEPGSYLLHIRGRAEYWSLSDPASLAQCNIVRRNQELGSPAHGAQELERVEAVQSDADRIYVGVVHQR